MTCANNPNETAECRQAHSNFDAAHREYLRLVGVIKAQLELILAGGATIVAGGGLAAIPVLGWVPGFLVAVAGAGFATGAWLVVRMTRKKCQAQINIMYDEYVKSHQFCETDACKMKRPEYSVP